MDLNKGGQQELEQIRRTQAESMHADSVESLLRAEGLKRAECTGESHILIQEI